MDTRIIVITITLIRELYINQIRNINSFVKNKTIETYVVNYGVISYDLFFSWDLQ